MSYLATVGLGAVAVPLNPSSPAHEIERELAVVEPTLRHRRPDRDGAPGRRSIQRSCRRSTPWSIAEGEAPARRPARSTTCSRSEPVRSSTSTPTTSPRMMFTSGTAGPPKAAMLSHGNLLANIEQDLTARDHIRPGDVVYGVLPLFHIFGLNVVLGVSLTVGATVVLVQRFDPATAVQSIVQRQVTVVPGAPPMWIAFSHFDELPDDTFASVRLALSGASRSAPVGDRAHARSVRRRDPRGVRAHRGVAGRHQLGRRAVPARVGRAGAGRPGDASGRRRRRDVPVGDVGEIWVRGENVFLGYSTSPRRPHACWSTAGCTPATSASSTTTATSTSSTAPRT